MNNCPKVASNQSRALPTTDQQRPLTSTPRGKLPAPGASQQTRNFKKPQAEGQVYWIEAGEEESEDPPCSSVSYVCCKYPTK